LLFGIITASGEDESAASNGARLHVRALAQVMGSCGRRGDAPLARVGSAAGAGDERAYV